MAIFICRCNCDNKKIIVERTQYFDIYYHLEGGSIISGVTLGSRLRTARLFRVAEVKRGDGEVSLQYIHHFFRSLYLDLADVKEVYAIYGAPTGGHGLVSFGSKIGYSVKTSQHLVIRNFTTVTPRIVVCPAKSSVDLEFNDRHAKVSARHNVCADWRDLFFIIGSDKHRDEQIETCDDESELISLIDAGCVVDLSPMNITLNTLVLSTGEKL